jgi:GTP-binding protein
MPLFQQAVFHTTVAHLRDLPTDSQCEVAFAGRSNSGKSSAINTLANHSRLAFVSKTPGRTQHLNYFRLDPGKYFVDLPGYGFAKAPEEIRSQWEGLLAPYLRHREALCGLVLIMDSRHPLTELDLQMLGWFAPTGKPIHVLLSKADKLTRQEQALAFREGTDGTDRHWQQLHPATLLQLEEVGGDGGRGGSWRLAGSRRHTEAPPPTGLATEKTARAKKRSAIGWGARSVDRAGGRH